MCCYIVHILYNIHLKRLPKKQLNIQNAEIRFRAVIQN